MLLLGLGWGPEGQAGAVGGGDPALTLDASADAGTPAPELMEGHRVPRGPLTQPHQLLHWVLLSGETDRPLLTQPLLSSTF